MRGDHRQPDATFCYVSAEERVSKDHPLRAIRPMVDAALREMSREFDRQRDRRAHDAARRLCDRSSVSPHLSC